jgi:hypothetical protein
VDSEEAESEGPGEEYGFRDEAPVYSPFVEEDAAEFKGAGKVSWGALSEGVAV